MNTEFLVSALNNMGVPTKVNRARTASVLLGQASSFDNLVSLAFTTTDELSIKAAWILEWICTHHGIEHILDYLDFFCKNISELKFNSAIRPCAKICEHLAVSYTSKKENPTKSYLTEKHINSIVETCFDWLISDQKIAVMAYSVNTLYLLGLEKKWVHIEL
ncbi:MAG: adenylosuccinate lyase [Tenacibaculum sp.]